jgi:hypothetical protein
MKMLSGMTAKLFRLVWVCEFLLAMIAIFIVWPEIGGESALEAMHWAWKLGFGTALALATVAFTVEISAQDAFWSMRSARWLAAIITLIAGMAVVTYYYSLEESTNDSDETNARLVHFLLSGPVRSS